MGEQVVPEQVKPASTKHELEHPSFGIMFPSSHVSGEIVTESLQIG